MKIKTIILMSIVALCTVACSDENEMTTASLTGNYEGYTVANCAYMENVCSANETVKIVQDANGSLNILFESDTWGTFIINNIQINDAEGTSTLSGNGKTEMGMNGNITSYDCSFTATIKKKEAEMQFKVPTVMGGLSIDFKTGEAPSNLLLSGTYKGYTDADCGMFQDKYTDNEAVKLSAGEDGKVTIEFKSGTWGNFEVEHAAISKENNEYLFKGAGKVSMGMGGSTNSYDFTVNGKTDAKKEVFSISFSVPAVMNGLTITLLPGTAPVTEDK